jgi:hypothetical protein
LSATGSEGGLSIQFSASPSQGPPGTTVTFTIKADETHAPGQMHYQLSYGDGAQDSNVTNSLCTQGPGGPLSQTWTLMHQYNAAGTYTVTLNVGANCTPDKATATLVVKILS